MDFDSAQIHNDDIIPATDTALSVVAAKTTAPAVYQGAAVTRDRYTKKVFVLDISASMGGEIAAQSEMACLVWPEEFWVWAEQRIANAAVRVDAVNAATATDDDDTSLEGCADVRVPYEGLDNDDQSEDCEWAELRDVADDRDLVRRAVLAHNLQAPFELNKPFLVSKAELVKLVVARTVRERVAKFPDAVVIGIMFDDKPHLVQVGYRDEAGERKKRNPTPEEFIKIVQEHPFRGGGTNITKALGAAVVQCKRAPSPVKQHHVVLVTDGEDCGVTDTVQYVETMLENNICLDVIHITDTPRESADLFRDVCQRTGGEYQQADNVNDFQTRFLAAASRLMLTAGGAA